MTIHQTVSSISKYRCTGVHKEEDGIKDTHHRRSQPGRRARFRGGFGKASARLIGILGSLKDKKMSGNTPLKNLSPSYQLFFPENILFQCLCKLTDNKLWIESKNIDLRRGVCFKSPISVPTSCKSYLDLDSKIFLSCEPTFCVYLLALAYHIWIWIWRDFHLRSPITVSTSCILCPDVQSKITLVPWRRTTFEEKMQGNTGWGFNLNLEWRKVGPESFHAPK